MSDYYETRKAPHGCFVPRKPEDLLPGFPSGKRLLRRYFNPHRAAELFDIASDDQFPSCVLLSMEPGSEIVRAAVGVHTVRPFSELCLDSELKRIAEEMLGGKSYIHQSRINFKRAGVGSGWHWHSDFETWHAQDGMTRPLAVTAMIPLAANTADNGPLLVIPESHRIYWSAPRGEEHDALENFSDQKDGVPSSADIVELKRMVGSDEQAVLMEPGDVFFFDCNLMHGSKANASSNSRTNMFVVFNRTDNKLTEPYSTSAPRPIQMGHRE